MQATIEIDDKLIPDCYELVAFRWPKIGDEFIRDDGAISLPDDYIHRGPRLIVRRKWQWPSWLTCYAIAKDRDGTWYGFRLTPKWDGNQWIGRHEAGRQSCNAFRSGFVDLSQFPDCEPEDSLRINPNWKE